MQAGIPALVHLECYIYTRRREGTGMLHNTPRHRAPGCGPEQGTPLCTPNCVPKEVPLDACAVAASKSPASLCPVPTQPTPCAGGLACECGNPP